MELVFNFCSIESLLQNRLTFAARYSLLGYEAVIYIKHTHKFIYNKTDDSETFTLHQGKFHVSLAIGIIGKS